MTRALVVALPVATAVGALLFLFVDLLAMRVWVPFEPHAAQPFVFAYPMMPRASSLWQLMSAACVIWSGLYLFALAALAAGTRTWERRTASFIFGVQSIVLLLFCFAPLPLDSDQYAYVGYGDLTVTRNNPYVPTRAATHASPQLERVASHWGDPIVADRYGPAFTLGAAALLLPFSHASVETQARVLRLAAGLAALLVSWMIWSITVKSPWRMTALAAFALSPLVLVQVGLNGHNEIFLVLFALAAYALALRNRFVWASVALAVATTIKFATAPFVLPLLAAAYFRSRSIVTVVACTAVFALVVFAVALPFGWHASVIVPLLEIRSNGGHVAYFLWRAAVHITHARSLSIAPFNDVVPILLTAATFFIAWAALHGRRYFAVETFAVVATLFAAVKIEPWYAIILTPLVVLPRSYALGVFIGGTLAAQIIERSSFYTLFPYTTFYVAFVVIAFAVTRALDAVRKRDLPVARPAVYAGGKFDSSA